MWTWRRACQSQRKPRRSGRQNQGKPRTAGRNHAATAPAAATATIRLNASTVRPGQRPLPPDAGYQGQVHRALVREANTAPVPATAAGIRPWAANNPADATALALETRPPARLTA